MAKKLFYLFLLTLLTNCSKDNQENTNAQPDQKEDAIPVISIMEFDDLIEKRTSLKVSVSGVDEQTTTKVLINDNEVIATTQKNFEFELNPFNFPNGQTALKVKSVTSSNNESEKSKEFEIKKLLFRSFGALSSESVDSYIAINLQSNGELVAFKKIITYEDPIFFHAEDDFIEEDIIVTQYFLSNNTGSHLARIYGNVKPGTELIPNQEVADSLGLDYTKVNKDSNFNVNVEGNTNLNLFFLLGQVYGSSWNYIDNILEINYDKELTDNVFIYYFTETGENIFDNYRYAYINDLTNQTLIFDEMSTVTPEDIHSIELPQTVKKANVLLSGFSNEYDYREANWRFLFNDEIETQLSGYSLEYPNIKEYPIINKSISLEFVDESEISFVQRGVLDITIPDLTIQKNDSIIKVNGEYDFSELNLEVVHPNPDNNENFRMIYKNRSLDSIRMPFKNFEIPEEIVEFLNQRGLGVTKENNSGKMELRLFDYQNSVFPNGVFYRPLRGESGDTVSWVFPLQN